MFLNKGPGVLFWVGATIMSSDPEKQLLSNVLGNHPGDVGHSRQGLPNLVMAAFCLLWTFQREIQTLGVNILPRRMRQLQSSLIEKLLNGT